MKNSSLWKDVSPSTALGMIVTAVLIFAYLQLGVPWLSSLGAGSISWILPFVLVYAGLLVFLKRTVLAGIAQNYEMQPMSPRDFAQAQNCSVGLEEPIPAPVATSDLKAIRQLDLPRIESLTSELQSLGFSLAREGQLLPDKANKQVIYARIFEHPSGATASVMQIFTATVVLPVVFSIENAFEERWNWSDSNQKRNWLTFMMRRPRVLGKFHPVESGAAALWASCSEQSAKIERELGVKRCPFVAQNYEAYLAQALAELTATFRRKNIIIGAFEGIFILPRSTEWWGEYAKYAKKS